jgi:hypothetical protein
MRKILAAVILSCIILPQLAFAGAWTVPKGNLWSEYYMSWNWAKSDYNRYWEPDRKDNDGRSWGFVQAPKAEYGLTNWCTLLGGLEYKEAFYKQYSRPPAWGTFVQKNHGITEVNFGTRIRFMQDPFVLSGQAKAFIYTGCEEDKLGDPVWDNQPGISDRNDAFELRGLLGKQFRFYYPCYIGLESGYRWKNRSGCNDIPLFGEFGFWPVKWLLIKTEVDGYLCHDGTGDLEKDYFYWRVGPVFQLLDIYQAMTGNKDDNDFENSVTRAGKLINIETQYGYCFAGRNTSRDQQVILKVSIEV